MLERYLVGSDVHDDVEALEKFADFGAAKEVSRIVITGDMALRPYTKKTLDMFLETRNIPGFLMAKSMDAQDTLRDMRKILDATGLPYNVLPGNYDANKDVEEVFGDHNLHKKQLQFGDADVVGYGGADANPPHILLLEQLGGMEEFSHDDLYTVLERARADVIFTHMPAEQLCDDMFNGDNDGSPAITKHIITWAPRLIISGYIHESGPLGNNPAGTKGIAGYQNQETGDKTLALNPGNLGRFGLLDPRTLKAFKQFDYGTFLIVDVDGDGQPKKVEMYHMQADGRKIGDIRKIAEYDI